MNPNSANLLASPYMPSPLQISYQKKPPKLIKNKQTNKSPPLFLVFSSPLFYHTSSTGCCGMSYSIPFCPNGFICECSMQGIVGLVQDLWLRVRHQCWTSLKLLLDILLSPQVVCLIYGLLETVKGPVLWNQTLFHLKQKVSFAHNLKSFEIYSQKGETVRRQR